MLEVDGRRATTIHDQLEALVEPSAIVCNESRLPVQNPDRFEASSPMSRL
jgi:hypothetical protein